MSAGLRKVIEKHQKQAEKEAKAAVTDNCVSDAVYKDIMIGNCLFDLALLLQSKQKITEQQLKLSKAALLNILKIGSGLSQLTLKQIFGIHFLSLLQTTCTALATLCEQLSALNPIDPKPFLYSSLSSWHESNSFMNSNDISSISDAFSQFSQSSNPNRFDSNRTRDNDIDIDSQISKEILLLDAPKQQSSQQLYHFLSGLVSPTAELNQLCQQMKYPIKYEEKSPNTFMFTFMCEVSLKRKEKSLVFSDSYTANSKAKGKTGCSLKMLHRIYSAFPQIKNQYTEICKDKAIPILLNDEIRSHADRLAIMKEIRGEHQMQEAKCQQPQETQLIRQLSEIKSFKSDLNSLVQQNPGVIFQPTTLAVLQTEIGWSISWNIRILQDQIINFQCTRSTKKKAEEELAKQIVQTIYLKIPELQEKTLKEKKKIG